MSIEGVRKGHLFREKWYIKGCGVGPQGGASPYKNLLSNPSLPFPAVHERWPFFPFLSQVTLEVNFLEDSFHQVSRDILHAKLAEILSCIKSHNVPLWLLLVSVEFRSSSHLECLQSPSALMATSGHLGFKSVNSTKERK